MTKEVTHIMKVEFYLSENEYISEIDLRNRCIGYFKALIPKMDIENIVIEKVE